MHNELQNTETQELVKRQAQIKKETRESRKSTPKLDKTRGNDCTTNATAAVPSSQSRRSTRSSTSLESQIGITNQDDRTNLTDSLLCKFKQWKKVVGPHFSRNSMQNTTGTAHSTNNNFEGQPNCKKNVSGKKISVNKPESECMRTAI